MNYDREELIAAYGSISAAARAIGIPRTTLQDRLNKQPTRQFSPLIKGPLNIDEIIEHRTKWFEDKYKESTSELWQAVPINETRPFAIVWVGDPHLDDDGCNWPLLREHIQLMANTEGVYAINVGDSANSWIGKLVRLYGNQETSKQTARRLVEWFLNGAGINWLMWIMGNHDQWDSTDEIITLLNKNNILLRDWDAKFKLVFPKLKNSEPVLVHAAHNFPGHSMWNITHGPMRAAKMTSDAELYVCGHIHDWGVAQFELAERSRSPIAIRTRGYKFIDSYSIRKGYQQSQGGASIMTIIDPTAKSQLDRVMVFTSIENGCKVLKALRG
jgi:hypothetical protein